MPRQPFTRSRAFQIVPGDSPSRIASCHRRRRIRHSASPKASHVCAEITLRHNATTRNGKTFHPCAETVDDDSSLWKAEEKHETIVR
jgi:hypothetical protein